MIAFELFVHDDRYSVPTLHLISADDERAARRAAQAMLRSSPHHLGVELCRDGELLQARGACEERRPTETAGPLAGGSGGFA